MPEQNRKLIYRIGAAAALIFVIGTIFDITLGSTLGGDLSKLPQTAVGRFDQFAVNPWLGLYNLDLLNMVLAIVAVPMYLAIAAALRLANGPLAGLALAFVLLSTAIFVATNTALPMLDLSRSYLATDDAGQKAALAAAGEALLARGAHGRPGVFVGFAFSTLSSALIALAMLKGGVFRPVLGIVGLVANLSLLGYLVTVTFLPSIKNIAVAVAAPGGLLSLAWLLLIAQRLFSLGQTTPDRP